MPVVVYETLCLCCAAHRGTSVSQIDVDEEFINSALQQLDPEHGLVCEVAPLPRRLRDTDVHLPLDAPPRYAGAASPETESYYGLRESPEGMERYFVSNNRLPVGYQSDNNRLTIVYQSVNNRSRIGQ